MKVLDRVAPNVRSLRAYHAPSGSPAVKLDANELPFAWSDAARAKFGEIAARVSLERYPDPHAKALRHAIAERIAADPNELVFGSGSDELISLLLTTFASNESGDAPRTLVVTPSFVMYRIAGLSHGYEVTSVPLREDHTLDADAVIGALRSERIALVWLASPNNPTGNTFDRAAIESVIDAAAEAGTLVVLDEAYSDYADERLAPFFGVPNVVLLGTLSKIGLAALRVGWARLPLELAEEVEKVRAPFNVNALSQAIATYVLTEARDELEAHIDSVRDERSRVASVLREHAALRVHPSQANFVLVDVLERHDELLQTLAEDGIAVRSFASAGGTLSQSFRLTIGTPRENDLVLEAFTRWQSGR